MTMKSKSVRLTSPKGTAVYPWLNEPDRRFDNSGVYGVTLRLNATDKDTVDFIAKVKKVAADHFEAIKKETKKAPKKADLPIKMVVDEDGNETGEVDIKFKLKSQGGSGDKTWTQKPALFDSQGKPMKDKVGGGSIIKVGTEIAPFFTPTIGVGVTLRLKAVQVIDLQEYSGSSSESWFTKEDGFVSESKDDSSSSEQESLEESEETAASDF
jgi:hypothetical protein